MFQNKVKGQLLTKPVRTFTAIVMSLLLSNVPALASTEALPPGHMIATSTVIDQMTETQARQKVSDLLKRDDVRTALAKRGVSETEINSRLATLTHKEMLQLNRQLEEARFGGDVLVTILVVVLIIFLIQRI